MSHDDYFNGKECVTNFECRRTMCCKKNHCVRAFECEKDSRYAYIIVGIIAFAFLIIVMGYYLYLIIRTRKTVRGIQEVNSAKAREQRKQMEKVELERSKINCDKSNDQLDSDKTHKMLGIKV